MNLKVLPDELSVCRLASVDQLDLAAPLYFIGKTDEELSLVCRASDVPAGATAREDGWRGFRIEGVLDFSLVGVLAKLSGILAENGVGLFAVSTYNTDYILVRQENLERALGALSAAGYEIH